MITICLKILLSLIIWMFCVSIGFIFTETKLRIARLDMFDFAPLNCKRCFTFWITFFVSIISVFVLNQTLIGILVFILAILTAISMYIEDKNLIQ